MGSEETMTNTPNAEQIQALKQFAAANGRTWKSELRDLWMNGAYNYAVLGGADPACLQQVRNEFGPSWLARFSLKQEAKTWNVCDRSTGVCVYQVVAYEKPEELDGYVVRLAVAGRNSGRDYDHDIRRAESGYAQ